MEITKEQFVKIETYLPRQRGNVKISNYQCINAMLYIMETRCPWRLLPKEFGNWHTVYVRMNRWSKNGTLQNLFKVLKEEGIIEANMKLPYFSINSLKIYI